jgi:hypothetical protein
MSHRLAMWLVPGLLCSLVCVSIAQAQWVPDGTPICRMPDDQDLPLAVADGYGGAIIAWRDYRTGYPDRNIYVQRIDALGNVLWTADGVRASNPAVVQISHRVVSDGAGGAILVWYEGTYPEVDIYAQRVDTNGNVSWTATGVPICTVANTQWEPCIAGDGSGGAIIAWSDLRGGADYDLYAQRVDANGNVLWTADGVTVSDAANDQNRPQIVSDGAGGAIVAWQDSRGTDTDVYVQRLDGGGNALWTVGGVPVALDPSSQDAPQVTTDGLGGAIVAWSDLRNGSSDIYARRVNAAGDTLWAPGGVAISTAADGQWPNQLVSDGGGGAIVVWRDDRNGEDQDVYTQRVDANGTVLWTADGLPVAVAVEDQSGAQLTTDGAGGAIITWIDWQDPESSYVRAQRVDSLGSALWSAGGEPVSPPGSWPEEAPAIASDGVGGAIIAWKDWRNLNDSDIYAQRVEGRFGKWGVPPPYITSVEDVTADQGGYASVNWLASPLDVYNVRTITHYSVWRAIKPVAPTSAVKGGDRVVDLPAIGRNFEGPAYRVERRVSGDYYWEWIANMDAFYFEAYSFTAPTLHDSVAGDPGMHYFQVVAHTADQFVFWVSNPDSGYSVDNLSPAVPQGFAGSYDSGPSQLTLNWNANMEPDLSHYSVYRGVGMDFTPTDLNRIATSTDTSVTDLPYPPEQPYYLKLSAFDIHGNESLFATLAPESIYVPTRLAGFVSTWKDEYVEVSWTLSELTENVTFEVMRKEEPEGKYRMIAPEIELLDFQARFEDASVIRGRTYTYRISAVEDGTAMVLFETTVSIPSLKLTLYQNYPNPFKPETVIRFDLPEPASVELTVYDASGRRVATVLNGNRERGTHEVPFNARGLASGVYFYKLKVGSKTFSRKMILLR